MLRAREEKDHWTIQILKKMLSMSLFLLLFHSIQPRGWWCWSSFFFLPRLLLKLSPVTILFPWLWISKALGPHKSMTISSRAGSSFSSGNCCACWWGSNPWGSNAWGYGSNPWEGGSDPTVLIRNFLAWQRQRQARYRKRSAARMRKVLITMQPSPKLAVVTRNIYSSLFIFEIIILWILHCKSKKTHKQVHTNTNILMLAVQCQRS